VRMAPLHLKRKFWWELTFLGVLVFLLLGSRAQRQREVALAAIPVPIAIALAPPVVTLVALVPKVEIGSAVIPLLPPLALK
jgi:hypothetical protein